MQGQFAFLENGGVVMINLPDCRARVLVAKSNAQPPLRFSSDGRYLAYGDGAVIQTSGHPQPQHPLGKVAAWAWSPHGTELAAVTDKGSVELWKPGSRPRRILPDGWAAGNPGELTATAVAFSLDGRQLALVRTIRPADARELWLLDLRKGTRRLLHRISDDGCLFLSRFTPDGRSVLFFPDAFCSASIAADGLPLAAAPVSGGPSRTLVRVMLEGPNFLARCGLRLVAAVGSGRETNYGKSLSLLLPPGYQAVSLGLTSKESWLDPSCSESGAIAVAADPASQNPTFGLEHRSIWLIPAVARRPVRLTSPGPIRVSDELPRISADGRSILFIRGRSNKNGVQTGELELLSLGSGGRARLIGPIAQLGQVGIGYYDYYGWYGQTDWHAR